MNLGIKKVTGAEIKPFIPQIARLRIAVFSRFPYLYDGDETYEREYLETYVKSFRSIAILVLNGQQIVGVSTGIPLIDETEEFQRPFIEQGINLIDIFYCGESLLLPEYRGNGIYKTFIRGREEHARSLEQFSKICFCVVEREDNHPLKPDSYQPLDPVWKSFGYRKDPTLNTFYSWKDIDKPMENEKTMFFWIKDL